MGLINQMKALYGEKIENKYGYDVIDHKNYNEVEPESSNAQDLITAT